MTALAILALLAIGTVSLRGRRRLRRSRKLVYQLRSEVERLQADLKHAEADRDHFYEKCGEAYLAYAALGADLHALEEASAAHVSAMAEELAASADGSTSSTLDRAEAEHLIAAVATDRGEPGDVAAPEEWCDGWDAALREYGEPLAAELRSAIAKIVTLDDEIAAWRRWRKEALWPVREARDAARWSADVLRRTLKAALEQRDGLRTELRAVTSDRDALGHQLIELQLQLEGSLRREGRAINRSIRHRRAVVHLWRCRLRFERRLADACAAVAGHAAREMERQSHRVASDGWRDESPCSRLDEFHDGELPPDQADVFRDHLAACQRCQQVLLGRMQESVAAATTRSAP